MTTQTVTEPQASTAKAADIRQFVSFRFFHLSPEWRRLPQSTKRKHANELAGVVDTWSRKLMVRTYSLIGMKADADFMIWRVGATLEPLQEMSGAVGRTAMGGYLSVPYSYLSMTKRSTYVDKLDPDHADRRRCITPANDKYLFVYPFVKSRDWYLLPLEERQAMMDEHIKIGNRFPSVRLHTTYSFGLDDQEFVVAFETNEPKDFLDLVMALRESKGSKYTIRDTPIFTCLARPMQQMLNDVGA
ncbi:MAG: chlorite dismutase family protein [Candidatus Omnitrophica bacterium]|nr:chlorite dismutase family protein [Candidatus Omnitrophota bacterium]